VDQYISLIKETIRLEVDSFEERRKKSKYAGSSPLDVTQIAVTTKSGFYSPGAQRMEAHVILRDKEGIHIDDRVFIFPDISTCTSGLLCYESRDQKLIPFDVRVRLWLVDLLVLIQQLPRDASGYMNCWAELYAAENKNFPHAEHVIMYIFSKSLESPDMLETIVSLHKGLSYYCDGSSWGESTLAFGHIVSEYLKTRYRIPMENMKSILHVLTSEQRFQDPEMCTLVIPREVGRLREDLYFQPDESEDAYMRIPEDHANARNLQFMLNLTRT